MNEPTLMAILGLDVILVLAALNGLRLILAFLAKKPGALAWESLCLALLAWAGRGSMLEALYIWLEVVSLVLSAWPRLAHRTLPLRPQIIGALLLVVGVGLSLVARCFFAVSAEELLVQQITSLMALALGVLGGAAFALSWFQDPGLWRGLMTFDLPMGGPQPRWVLPLVLVAVVLVFYLPIAATGSRLGYRDWDQHMFFYGGFLKSLFTYGQWPFWNPWNCGGNVMWSGPQIKFLSPAYLLYPFMSLASALKLNVLIHYLLGLWGMYELLAFGVKVEDKVLAFALSSAYVFSGGIALHLAVGHLPFLACFYLPWILSGFLRYLEEDDLKQLALSAIALAITIVNGGFNVLVSFGLGLGLFALLFLVQTKSWRVLSGLLIVGATGTFLAAIKLVPMIFFVTSEYFWDARNPSPLDYVPTKLIAAAFFNPLQTIDLKLDPRQVWGWHEYGNYAGFLIPLLFLLGLFWIGKRKGAGRTGYLCFGLTTLILILIAKGDGAYLPYQSLQTLPFFKSFRIPSRFLMTACFFMIVSIAYAVRGGVLCPKRRLFLACFLLADVVLCNRHLIPEAFIEEPRDWPPAQPLYTFDLKTDPYGPGLPLYTSLMEQRPILNGYEPLQIKRQVDPEQPLVYTLKHGGVPPATIDFTPNVISIHHESPEADVLVLNQNYIEGWSIEVDGNPYKAAKGFQVSVPPGKTLVRYSYSPPGLFLGLMGSLIGLAVTAFLWTTKRRF